MPANLPTIRSFEGAREVLGDRLERKIANNTWLRKTNADCISVYHHQTEIVAFFPHCLYFPTHSWRSRTTKERLNHFLWPFGLRIVQQNFKWLLTSRHFASLHCLDFSIWPKQHILYKGLPATELPEHPGLHLPEVPKL